MLSDQLKKLSSQGELTLSPAAVRHLPVIRQAIAELGIDRVLDRQLPADPRMKATDTDCVVLMILNVLCGRVALYRMADWLSGTDPAVVVGDGCCADWFTDTRLAETLDRLYDAGTDDVLSAVVLDYLNSDAGPSAYAVHQDTTTVKLHGAYVGPSEDDAPVPRHGHSKDHRPDLLQLVYGLSLQGAVGVPVCMSVLDGNTSDQAANRLHIDRLAGLLPAKDEVTLVADGKLCDGKTLGRVRDAAFHFVTLVPRSYGIRDDLVERVREVGEDLPELGRAHQRRKSDPVRHYRGRSFTEPFELVDPESGVAELHDLRFLVVESPALAAREQGALKARLAKERKRIEDRMKRLSKQTFSCQDDAQGAAERAVGAPSYHAAEVRIHDEVVTVKRPGRGRPRKGESQPTKTIWRVSLTSLEVDQECVDRAGFHGRHFLLVTDHLDTDAWPDERVLSTYREQHMVEGHTGFRWLKGPAAVAPAFLKTPSRIAALGLVFILALMVRNYLEWAIRAALAKTEQTLPNMNGQATQRPSAENAFYYFRDASLIIATVGGHVANRELHGLRPEAEQVLELLGWSPDIFTKARLRKRKTRSAGKAGM